MAEPKSGELIRKEDGAVQKFLNLQGDPHLVDVSPLSEAQVQALANEHAKNLVNVQALAQNKRVDLGATQSKLDTYTQNVAKMSSQGISATITNVSEDSLGRTETIIGNSEHAQKGLLSNRQAGLKNNTLIYVIIGAIVVVMLAFAFARH